ncbi:MAG: hypothetical protein AB8B97_06075 [Granulosicoccus sp.]
MTYATNDQQHRQGSMLLASAIDKARDIMYEAHWVLDSSDPEQEKAAAEQQLKNQLVAALDKGFALHDANHPEFRILDQYNQYGLYNPDNRYHIATISTPGKYVIRGKRGTSADLQIQVGTGEPGFDVNLTSPVTISQLALADLVVDDDGYFEIIISDCEEGDNWLNNTEVRTVGGVEKELKANSILIRESFMDWQEEVGGTWYIERQDTRGEPNPVTSPELINHQYQLTSDYLLGSVRGWIKFVEQLRPNLRVNRLSEPRETKDGLPGQWNSAGQFPIDSGKAIIITVEKSTAPYQSIQVGDLWFNALDFCRRQISLNMAQAQPDNEGNYRFVISVEDPGVANWLDPAGASTSFVFLRWQSVPADYDMTQAPAPSVEIVDFDKLCDCLPDEPRFCRRQRKEQLAARQAASLSSPRGF